MKVKDFVFITIILFLIVVGIRQQQTQRPRLGVFGALRGFAHAVVSVVGLRHLIREDAELLSPRIEYAPQLYNGVPLEPLEEPIRYLASDGTPLIDHGYGW